MMTLVFDSHPSAFFSDSKQEIDITHITDCVCQEFETVSKNIVSSSDSVTSFQIMRLLIPHIESLLQVYMLSHSHNISVYCSYA